MEFDPAQRRNPSTGRRARGADHPLRQRKLAEIERTRRDGAERIGHLSEREFLMAGLGLYAGDGGKRDGTVVFSNSDPRLVEFSCRWLRNFFDIDERRLRCRLYLHAGLDLPQAQRFWSDLTGVPPEQFHKPYRAVVDGSIRHNKHEPGLCPLVYGCTRTQRRILGLLDALPSAAHGPG